MVDPVDRRIDDEVPHPKRCTERIKSYIVYGETGIDFALEKMFPLLGSPLREEFN